MNDSEHLLVSDARYWSESHPLLEQQNTPGFVSVRIHGEITEFIEEIDRLLVATKDQRDYYTEKAAREAADIGVFAIGLLLQLQHDPSVLLHGLSETPPKRMPLPKLREKLLAIQQKYEFSTDSTTNRPKFLDIYETLFLAWTAAESLGRDYTEEYRLKSQYNHHRYPGSEFQLDGLEPEDYHDTFLNRIATLKKAAVLNNAEERFYQENRKPRQQKGQRLERLKSYRRTAGMYIQAGISLITGLNVL